MTECIREIIEGVDLWIEVGNTICIPQIYTPVNLGFITKCGLFLDIGIKSRKKREKGRREIIRTQTSQICIDENAVYVLEYIYSHLLYFRDAKVYIMF